MRSVARPKKINIAEFFYSTGRKKKTLKNIFSIGKFLTWLHYTARKSGGLSQKQLRIGYLEKHNKDLKDGIFIQYEFSYVL